MDSEKDFYSDRLVLRSENARKVIGEIPPTLVYSGIVVAVIILILLLLSFFLLPYPYGSGESIFQHVYMEMCR